MHKHLLTYAGTPRTSSSNDSIQHNRLLIFQGIVNGSGEVLHTRRIRKQLIMPGLDKHIKDASTDSLALHSNLFGQINLHHARTLCVNYVQSAAPNLGLTTATTHGTADLPIAMHKHLCSYLTRNGPDRKSTRLNSSH